MVIADDAPLVRDGMAALLAERSHGRRPIQRCHRQWVATSMPLLYVAPFAALATVAVIPVTVAVLNAVAYWPARAAANTPPAAILRTE